MIWVLGLLWWKGLIAWGEAVTVLLIHVLLQVAVGENKT